MNELFFFCHWKGIRVNSVNPGFIDTDFHMSEGMTRDDDEYANMCEMSGMAHPLGRIGQVDDCVNAIAFLAKESSNFITGVLLPVSIHGSLFFQHIQLV